MELTYAYMDTNPDNAYRSQKSWYFFDNEVVHAWELGSITSTYPAYTVNQCFLKGGILVDKEIKKKPTRQTEAILYKLRNGYCMTKLVISSTRKKKCSMTAEHRADAGMTSTPTSRKKKKKMDVFALGINHGVGRKTAHTLTLVPGKTSAQDEGLSEKNVPLKYCRTIRKFRLFEILN